MVLENVPDLNTSLLASTGNDTFIKIRMVCASIAGIELQSLIFSDSLQCPGRVRGGRLEEGHRVL